MLAALEASYPASLMRTSFVLYPVVNAIHILAIGALVTGALLMDLRLLGFAGSLSPDSVIIHLRPVAIASLVAAVVTGLLLFSVRPTEYAANPAFLVKMGLLALAVLNAGLFTLGKAHRRRGIAMWIGVSLSMLLWPAVLLAGRFIGFLE